jgi:hypothetical protein
MDECVLMNDLMKFLMDELVLFHMMMLNFIFVSYYFVFDTMSEENRYLV